MKIKTAINAVILRLLGASSVDAIMSGFQRTIRKLEAYSDHQLAVSDALDQQAEKLRAFADRVEVQSNEAAERALEADARAAKLRELFG